MQSDCQMAEPQGKMAMFIIIIIMKNKPLTSFIGIYYKQHGHKMILGNSLTFNLTVNFY